MPASKNLGLPCLLPVQVETKDGVRSRGFVTRLAEGTACISSDPELVVGDLVQLTIRRPADEETVVLSGQVARRLDEGGLWRGRSAALVELSTPLPDNFLGTGAKPNEDVSDIPLRRGSEPRTNRVYRPGRPGAAPLSSGLGRRKRKRTGRNQEATASPATSPAAAQSNRPAPLGEPKQLGSIRSEDNPPAAALESAELNAPVPLALQGQALESAELSPPSAEGLTAPAAPPPVHTTDEHIKAITDSNLDITGLDELPLGEALSAVAEDEPSAPLPIPDGPIVLDKMSLIDGQPPALVSVDSLSALEDLGSGDIPPPAEDSSDFWEDASWTSGDGLESIGESLIPRAARIPSGVPVHFWTLGQRIASSAVNFSSEGMFLAYDEEAPARGATVRVEFALGQTQPEAAIRFNAEVRWHRSDRPGGDLPEGFGVQILDFETLGDEDRYSKLLLYLLSIQAPEALAEH